MIISSFQQAIAYLESHIRQDVFTRFEGDKHLTDPLERMRYLLTLLGNPQRQYQSIQVTGTSGKGSTAYFVSHLLKTAGYSTGFTLSPHLESPFERMQINNEPISEQSFISVLNDVIPAIEQMTGEPIGKPSYFEILLSMAFLYFAQQKVEWVVAEVGLEGTYDGTNSLLPDAFVLTNISLDHTAILGSTVEEIAQEAISAIQKDKKPSVVITGVLQPSVQTIVYSKCESLELGPIQYQKDFTSEIHTMSLDQTRFTFTSSTGKTYENLCLPLKGRYQVDNASLALETLLQLVQQGKIRLSEDEIRNALLTAFFPGRFEMFRVAGRQVILDGAHNEAKMDAFLHALAEYYPEQKKHFVIGFKKDKDVTTMVQKILPYSSKLYLTAFNKSTDMGKQFAMTVDELERTVLPLTSDHQGVVVFSSCKEAVQNAIEEADENTIISITGSLYLVGELRGFLTELSQSHS